MSRVHTILAVVAALLTLVGSARAKVEGSLAGSISPGVDTNPRRIVGEESSPDFFVALTGNAKGRLLLGSRHLLGARYDLGLKKFLETGSEDVAVQQLDADYACRLGAWALGFDASGKLRLSTGATRDYGDALGGAFLAWTPLRSLAARVSLGARWFRYPPDHAYSSFGPQAGLSLRWAPMRQLGFALGVVGALPGYEGRARLENGEMGAQERRDRRLSVHLQASFRGPLAVQGAYLWSGSWSNSFGESAQRHRISAALTAQLPWSLYASLHAAWQRIHYPDGIFLSKELLDMLLYDDEAQSSLAVKLARPVSRMVDLELRYSLHWIELPRRGDEPTLTYVRQTAAAGASIRW